MNCREYIDRFLSAHADAELSGVELQAAEQHVASCRECASRLAEERALKGLLRRHAGKVETPAAVRAQVLAALVQEAAGSAGAISDRPPSRERGRQALRRPALWIPLSVAAVLALAIVTVRGVGLFPSESVRVVHHPGGVPEFDEAIARFEQSNRNFRPNVPSDSFGEVAGAYVGAHMPGYIWNFNGSGLKLVGGRLDKLSDGRTVTYTFYKGDQGAILCIRYKISSQWNPPAGAVHEMAGHEFYSYYGYSICYSYTPVGNFVCLLITRIPVNQLLETVQFAAE